MDARDFYSAFGKFPKFLFVLLLQLKDALFLGICIIWCGLCEERQQSRAKLIAGFIGRSKRIGGGFRFAFQFLQQLFASGFNFPFTVGLSSGFW
ncbi:MAG: hypothetical protein IJ968_03355 [Clostridia bacterium]|nr:hypothetical protein [Clostridia bacterium]